MWYSSLDDMPAIDKVILIDNLAGTDKWMGIMILYFLGSLTYLGLVLHNILIKK